MSTINLGNNIVRSNLAFNLDPTVSAGYIKTPKQISNCVTWFDASDTSTITTESGGSNIRYWSDKSNSNLLLTGGGLTLANEPTLVSSGLNGLSVVRFDGGDYMSGNFTTSYTEFTIFLVMNANTNNPPTYQRLLSINNGTNTNTFHFDINDPDGSNFARTLWTYWNSGGSPYLILPLTSPNTTSDFVQGSPTLITFSHTNAGSGTNAIYVNGRFRTDQSSTGTQTITIGGSGFSLYLGAYSTAPNGPYKGDIAEVIIYSRQLSVTERRQVEYYLSNKWRIPFQQVTLTNVELINRRSLTCQNNNIPVIDKSYRLNPANATGSPLQSNFYFADAVSWLSPKIATAITMEAWVKPNSFTFYGSPGSDLGTIMIANSNFYLSIDGNGKFNFYLVGSAGSTSNHLPSTTSVTRHAWNHVVITFDGLYVRWYLNGVLDKTSSTTYNIGTITLTNYLGIGAEGSGTFGRVLDGYIGGCRIYGTALSAAQILQNYEQSKTEFSNLPNIVTSNLNIYLDADVYSSYIGSGTTWTDLSGNGYNFTMYSNQTATAFSYNQNEPKTFTLSRASNNWSRLASGGTITLGSNETVSFWINTTGASSNSQYGLFSHCSGGPVNLAYGMVNNKMIYWYYDTTWNTKLSTASINDGTWKHITWVKTGGTTMNMYIDGALDSTHVITNVSGPVNTVGAIWGPCDATPSYNQLFDGKIANFMHYNTGLTAAQVLQNYNAQKHRFGK